MLGAAAIVFAGAVAMLVLAWFRRGTPGLPFVGERENARRGDGAAVRDRGPRGRAGGPVRGRPTSTWSSRPRRRPPASTAMTIDVIGHQWWWEVRYPGTRARSPPTRSTSPSRTRVNVVATTADVIHSFWVPAAEPQDRHDPRPPQPDPAVRRPARARTAGQCAEFCGLQHAHMALYVFAQPRRAVPGLAGATWRRRRRRPTTAAGARRRAAVHDAAQCASCHRIAGTPAQGDVGPDLTHLASRDDAGRADDPQHPDRARSVDPQPAGDQARRPDARPGAVASRGLRARRLPGDACSSDGHGRHTAGRAARRAPRADLGRAPRAARLADDHRPQADRDPLLLHRAGLLRRRRGRGAADPHPADRSQPAPALAPRPTTRCSRCTGSR